ncbi:major histocompatibility complex class I-related gene protein-like isoform X3 [Parambassis ranga]|uniref:Major histocompatibility complex class I-related gene protein-like isoform X3 n=1 Tax=Parambassis ranga TaxID=210632 RepID=A0A6P7HBM2_9TELE|nr:major histocompatibility complex class I-related gene protein-like isoform X3 [Parambassis ranga]
MQGRHPGSEMQVRHKRSLFSSKNQSKMKTFLLFLLLCHVSSAVKHTLRYFLTGSSGVSAFPDFLCVLEVNNIQAAYCDADIFGPKQDWGQTVAEHDPDQVHVYRNECYNKKPFLFKEMISTLKQRFNQTEGVHILQLMSGCELDDTTGQVSGFLQYGYDGEDFIVLDLNTLTWIAPTPKAVITKQRWDTERLRIEYNKRLYTEICPQWLKKFLHYGEKTLLRTDPPSVSLLQKTPSSAVSCHATGFYPDRALMFWSKDGEEIHEGVEHGEMLPNHDGTFQMSVDLTVSSVPEEDWRKYHCEFQFDGAEDRIITELDGAAIRTNSIPPSEFPAGGFIGVVVGLLLLLLCMAALLLWKKNKNGFRAASTSESS